MHIAVVGSGPAGITAAHRLQQAGHRVEVLEALDVVGGRTHAEHFGVGHHCDTGAGWLTSFYSRTLSLLDELGWRERLLRPQAIRGADELLIGGHRYPRPFSAESIAASPLLSGEEKTAMAGYLARLATEQANDLAVDLRYDGHDAETEFASLGAGALAYVLRPLCDGPFFTRLGDMSAAMVRSWLRAFQGAEFFQVAGGMDGPWMELARGMEVRAGEPVEQVVVGAHGVDLVLRASTRRYDGAVLAMPAPIGARLLSGDATGVPDWLDGVRYATHVRLYAARPSTEDVDIGLQVVPPGLAATVEFMSGRRGAWGACPPDWQWALICALDASTALLAQPAAEASRALWQSGRELVPSLFSLEDAAVTHLIRWVCAVPVMGPGHFMRMAGYRRRPPLVLAGDWTDHACVEGAVRSGEAAAAAFGGA